MKKNMVIVVIFCVSFLVLNAYDDFSAFQHHLNLESQRVMDSELHLRVKNSRDLRDYEVGDQKVFWRWNLNVMPPSWVQSSATCRAVGDHCYIFVDDEEWEYHMDQSDVQLVLNYLEYETMASNEYGAVEMDIELFGELPDELDNDPKLIVYYSALGSFQGTSFDGYFSSYNQVTEAEAQLMDPPWHSNECEMIYMTCHPLDPVEPIRISVLAHELQHLIHWGYDLDEEIWLNEGMSELAMVKFGVPDPIVSFNTQTDNSLNSWDQQFADYVKTMLFFTYLEEKFENGNLISDIVADPENSLDSITNQLILHGYQIPFTSIFNNWIIANYLDESGIYDDVYSYEALELPTFQPVAIHAVFPADNAYSLNPWAGEYIRVLPDENDLTLDINFSQPAALAVIQESTGEDPSIVETWVVSDSLTINLPVLTDGYSRIILAISNPNDSSLSYSYEICNSGVDSSEDEIQSISAISCYPNPFYKTGTNRKSQLSIQFSVKENNSGRLKIYNTRGQLIKDFGRYPTGDYNLNWDCRDQHNRSVNSGVYFINLESDQTTSKRLIVID